MEKEEKKIQKTVGEWGFARVTVYADEFEAIGIDSNMFGADANQVVREKLGLGTRSRARNPANMKLKEIKEAIGNDPKKIQELDNLLAKLKKQ